MSNKQKLAALEKKIKRCRRCRLWRGAKNAVPGEGPAGAKIMMIGEAPGEHEDIEGRPFVGASGKFLDKALSRARLKRNKIFITSVIKHRPPKNRNPKPDELKSCRVWWQEQVSILKPRLIVTLGAVATKEVVGMKSIKKYVGKPLVKEGVCYLPCYHPAAVIRFPRLRKKFMSTIAKINKLARCKE